MLQSSYFRSKTNSVGVSCPRNPMSVILSSTGGAMGPHIYPCPEMCAVLNGAKTLSAFLRAYKLAHSLRLFSIVVSYPPTSHTQLFIQTIYRIINDGFILRVWNAQVRVISDIIFAYILIRPACSKTNGQLHSVKGNVVETVSNLLPSFRSILCS